MPSDLRQQALALLARRDHSRLELQRKLTDGDNAEQLAVVLDELEQRGWLSDQRFAEQWVQQRGQRYGSQRLRHELDLKGVAAAEILSALALAADTELQRAQAVWRKKFAGALPATPQERVRQARFLQGRGFAFETIRQVLKGLDE